MLCFPYMAGFRPGSRFASPGARQALGGRQKSSRDLRFLAATIFLRGQRLPFFGWLAMSARRTRRSGGGSKCAWCKHMGTTVDACTWKARGQQRQFVVGADVAGACFGHMVAAVWDRSAVRQQNKDRLERCLALSVAERGNGAGAPPQHAWAASLLDATTLG